MTQIINTKYIQICTLDKQMITLNSKSIIYFHWPSNSVTISPFIEPFLFNFISDQFTTAHMGR